MYTPRTSLSRDERYRRLIAWERREIQRLLNYERRYPHAALKRVEHKSTRALSVLFDWKSCCGGF